MKWVSAIGNFTCIRSHTPVALIRNSQENTSSDLPEIFLQVTPFSENSEVIHEKNERHKLCFNMYTKMELEETTTYNLFACSS